MPEQWFSASMRVVCLIEGVGVSSDEVVHVFQAADWDGAFRRALGLGRTHETEYRNGDAELVSWVFDRVLTLDMIRTASLDGAEVFSRITDADTAEELPRSFDPEAHRPGQTGI